MHLRKKLYCAVLTIPLHLVNNSSVIYDVFSCFSEPIETLACLDLEVAQAGMNPMDRRWFGGLGQCEV